MYTGNAVPPALAIAAAFMLSILPVEPAGSASSMGEFFATKAMSVAVTPSLQRN
jgi:hypothetical protein